MTTQTDIQNLIDKINAQEAVDDSAIAFANGVPTLINNAVAAATANGATAEELQPLTDLAASLDAKSQALAAAILANTPAAKG